MYVDVYKAYAHTEENVSYDVPYKRMLHDFADISILYIKREILSLEDIIITV